MNFIVIFHRIKLILSEPALFFEQLKTETGIQSAFIYLLVLGLWNSILSLLVNLLFKDYYYNFMPKLISGIVSPGVSLPPPTTIEIMGWGVFWYGLLLGLGFIKAGILHGWILIFGGKEKYVKTYQLYVYSSTPSLVLGWIPFIEFLTWIYDLILLIIGTQRIHKISRMKSFLMYVIPTIVIILFFIAILFLSFYILKYAPLRFS